jgi:hypothetical protein
MSSPSSSLLEPADDHDSDYTGPLRNITYKPTYPTPYHRARPSTRASPACKPHWRVWRVRVSVPRKSLVSAARLSLFSPSPYPRRPLVSDPGYLCSPTAQIQPPSRTSANAGWSSPMARSLRCNA